MMRAPAADTDEQRGATAVPPGAFSALLQQLAAAPTNTVREDLPAFRPGQVVGRFELLREIGRGGIGVVYEARDTKLDRTVALKMVRAVGPVDVREERLLSEAEAAARLSHPNIVTLHDVGRSEEGPYLVLELLHGQTLARRLEQGSLPLREALRLAVEVAKGLAHAHAHDVVHRDLTPGNVFLCDDGQVKVLDFGMAHAFGRKKLDGGTRSRQSIVASKAATELDPLNAIYWANLGRSYSCAGEVDLARAALNRAMELSPDRYRYELGIVELLSGSPANALAAFERAPSEPLRLAGEAMAKHALGRERESQQALDRLIANYGAQRPYPVAVVYAWRGDKDRAFEWLQRSYDQRDLALSWIKVDPPLHAVRADPRYAALLRKMNLPLD